MKMASEVWLELPSPSTCLSPRVQQLLCQLAISDCADGHALTHDRLIDWNHLEKLLPEETQTEEYYVASVQALAPVFHAIHVEIQTWTTAQFHLYYGKYLAWTGYEKILDDCFIMSTKDSVSALQSVLVLASLLERCLGDIYLMKGQQCPSMLKDLLATKELQETFGANVIQFLRVMIGPPISLNIRNVAWHGFASPSEMHQMYCHLFFAIFASLGKKLYHSNTDSGKIIHRPPINFHHLEKLDLDVNMNKSLDIVRSIYTVSSVVLPSMKSTWKLIMDDFRNERYGYAMTLLLPQLENICRLIFTSANRCPQRFLTAESTVLFTTFDEMLSKYLPAESENRLPCVFGEGLMNALLDVLTYPEGPRVRDHISHGETDLLRFPLSLTNHVLLVSVAICIKFIPPHHQLHQQEEVLLIQQSISSYTSKFHPISLLKDEIIKVANELSKWKDCPRPSPEEGEEYGSWVTTIINTAVVSTSVTPETRMNQICQAFSDLQALQYDVGNVKIKTLFRNQSLDAQSAAGEEELVGLCRRIIREMLQVSHQVCEGLATRYAQWSTKTLRSRQRNTYLRMLHSIPDISSGLRHVLLYISIIYLQLSPPVSYSSIKAKIKFSKKVLQHVENLVTYTSMDKNRWEESVTLTSQFIQKIKPYLKI